MSEVRQTILKNDANTRQTVNSNKASGDVGSKKKSSNQKCKNSLPKNLRYDLENALVGLCDVWFEEIKPYLVRNNIKVHGDVGGGDLKRSSASPDCTHTDPGRFNHHRRRNASYADSSSMRLTASKVPYPKHPMRPLPVVLTENQSLPNQGYNWEKGTVRKPRKRRKCQVQTQPRPLIARLCRTWQQCTETTYPTTEPVIKIPIHSKNNKFLQSHYYQKPKKIRTMDASTQTDDPFKYIRNYKEATKNYLPLKTARCPSNTTFLIPSNIPHNEDPLFKDDLIDIIAEKHDKILKVLYTSPRRQEKPSVFNLFSPSDSRRKKIRKHQTIPPWK
ncbi:uncharacterized protein LOC124533995 isoform X1 [Vanessa cardui]|uniref:uncharacterized protein LOC124533995 isoform X1 n=1 Tax=Vanessa cardui TaxID=171605 RepID=UPI001F144A20|nr:uncharacterized protein LOC124533995 isoform X1 [Vanessa cardui]